MFDGRRFKSLSVKRFIYQRKIKPKKNLYSFCEVCDHFPQSSPKKYWFVSVKGQFIELRRFIKNSITSLNEYLQHNGISNDFQKVLITVKNSQNSNILFQKISQISNGFELQLWIWFHYKQILINDRFE